MGSMVMNMAANMLGLNNAATPLGLRAMQDLEKLNPRPGIATNAMCTFLAINTSSIQLIPATVVGILVAAKSQQPTAIIGTAFIATLCSTIAGITAVKLLAKLPAYRLPPVPDAVAASRDSKADSAETTSSIPPRRRSHLGLGDPRRVLCLHGYVAWNLGHHVLYTFAPGPDGTMTASRNFSQTSLHRDHHRHFGPRDPFHADLLPALRLAAARAGV